MSFFFISLSILLIILSIMPFRFIYVIANGTFPSYLRLNDNIYIYIHTFICIYIPHIFKNPNIDKHLGCLYTLTTMNYATMNIQVQYLLEIRVLFPLDR